MLLLRLLQACLGFLTQVLSLQAWYAQSTNNQGHLLDYRGLNYNHYYGYVIPEGAYPHKGLLHFSLMSLFHL